MRVGFPVVLSDAFPRQFNGHFAVLLVLRREDVFCSFVREKNVHERLALYGIPFCREMSAFECGFVVSGLRCVCRGEIRVVVHGLTAPKSCQEISIVGGELSKLRIDVSRSELFVDKHMGRFKRSKVPPPQILFQSVLPHQPPLAVGHHCAIPRTSRRQLDRVLPGFPQGLSPYGRVRAAVLRI